MSTRNGVVPDGTTGRRLDLTLVVTVFLACAYFHNGAVANQLARFDTIFSFVEPRTPDFLSVRIDRFVDAPGREGNTIDWASNPAHDAHFYSNKAPGIALAGIPVYAMLYVLERRLGYVPERHWLTYLNCYLLNLVLTALPVALSVPLFFRLAAWLTGGYAGWALALTMGLYAGTLVFPYATQLWGHATAAALVVCGVYYGCGPRPRHGWAGAALGAGVLCEYSVAITLASVAALLALEGRGRALARLMLGGLPAALLFAAYHHVSFGSAFTISNLHTNPVFAAGDGAAGLFGLASIGSALWGLTGSPFRGLFWHMPVLGVAGIGVLLMRPLARQPIFWLCLANVVGYFVMNLTFMRWDGGACVGPRYQIPALPFYFMMGALAVGTLRARSAASVPWLRPLAVVYAGLLMVSVANMFVTASISPLAAEIQPTFGRAERAVWENPLRLYYGKLAAGAIQPHGLVQVRMTDEPWTAAARTLETFVLGSAVGLRGGWAVVPCAVLLLGGFATAAAILYLQERGQSSSARHAPRCSRSTGA